MTAITANSGPSYQDSKEYLALRSMRGRPEHQPFPRRRAVVAALALPYQLYRLAADLGPSEGRHMLIWGIGRWGKKARIRDLAELALVAAFEPRTPAEVFECKQWVPVLKEALGRDLPASEFEEFAFGSSLLAGSR